MYNISLFLTNSAHKIYSAKKYISRPFVTVNRTKLRKEIGINKIVMTFRHSLFLLFFYSTAFEGAIARLIKVKPVASR